MEITNPRRFALTLAVLLSLPLLLLLGLWQYVAADLRLLKSGELIITEGTGAASLWQALVVQEFTTRTLPWRYHAWRQNAAHRLQTGAYMLAKGERASAVIARLAGGDTSSDEFTLTFPEGFTLEQMADRTAAKGIGSKEEFIKAAMPEAYRTQYPWLEDIPSGRSLEGYLFPDTYEVFADDTPAQVITRMLATFDKKVVQANLLAAAGHSPDETIIMASIIEREVISDSDMALAAGILWRRHDDGAGLDADATVRYALKKWDGPLTADNLQSESPYNTRRWRGLPPGPISNPGLRAITAAAKPEISDYYFYLSAPTGETIFAKTNDEHNANKAKHLQ